MLNRFDSPSIVDKPRPDDRFVNMNGGHVTHKGGLLKFTRGRLGIRPAKEIPGPVPDYRFVL